MEAHRREGEPIAREGDDQSPEGRHADRGGQGTSLGDTLLHRLGRGDRHGLFLGSRHDQPVHQGHSEDDDPHHVERRPPSDPFDQELREGDAERAGQPAQECHQQDRLLVARPVHARDHRKGGFVQGDGLAGTQPHPQHVEHRQRIDPGPQEEQQGRQHGATGHQETAVSAIDPGAHRNGAEARREEARGKGAEHGAARPAQLLCHRHDEQGEGVVDEAPGNELSEREHPQDGRGPLPPRSRCLRLRHNTARSARFFTERRP